MKGVAAHRAARQIDLLQSKRRQTRVHRGGPRQKAREIRASAAAVVQPIQAIEHAAALGEDRLVRSMMPAQRRQHRVVLRQLHVMKLRVAAGQPDRIASRQLGIGKRREKGQLGPKRFEAFKVGRIEEAESGISRDRDAPAAQRRRRGHVRDWRGKRSRLGQPERLAW